MKKLILFLCFIFMTSSYGQNIAFDFSFIKAEDIGAYDRNLKSKFQKVNQAYIDAGQILGWHVWKVVNGPQFPYTHLAVAIYDLENSDEDFEAPKWTELFPDLTEEELEDWGEKNAENRKIVFTTQVKNVAEVLQKGVTTYPDIAVCNFMKAKHGFYKSYEDYEKLNTKSISSNSLRKGWSLAKRIDNPGTDVSWTHFTVDWFDSYQDFLKTSSGPSVDWGATSQGKKFMNLRDLSHRVVFRKFIFLNKE